MITTITENEHRLTHTLTLCTEALKQATAERDELVGFVARCRDSVPDGYAADFESGAIACPEDVVSYVAAAFSELVAERDEQCRLNGMGAEREYVLLGKVAQLEREMDALRADAERLDWLENNLFNRENLTMFDKVDPDYNMWVLFSPVGVQGSARVIIDAAMKGKS